MTDERAALSAGAVHPPTPGAADPRRAVAGVRHARRSSGSGSRSSSRASATGSASSRSSPSPTACPTTPAPREPGDAPACCRASCSAPSAACSSTASTAQGHGDVRHRPGRAARRCCRSSTTSVGLAADLVRARDPHAALGAGQAATVPNIVAPEQLSSANSLSLVAAFGTFPLASSSSRCSPGVATVSATSTSSRRSRSTRRRSRSSSTR